MKPQLPGGLPHFEKGYYESLIIVLDTLEQCLALQAQESNHKHRGANNARIGHGEDNVVTSSASSGSTSKPLFAPAPLPNPTKSIRAR